MSQPAVGISTWVSIGMERLPALVLRKTSEGLEVAYVQGGYKVIADEVRWDGSQWVFANPGPSGRQLHGAEAVRVRSGPPTDSGS
mgnify:CR=1 FL=1